MIKTIHIIGLLALLLLTPTQVQSFQPFPDTGQTMCYDASHNEVSCDTIAPGDPYYGQDAHYQPRLPRSYTKLGHGGTVLPDNALHVDDGGPWMMTRDNVTGLIWEIKTKDNKNEQYNWQGAQEAFVAGLNNAVFAGFDDWRMPSREELASLLHRGTHNPTIDTCFFPNTVLSYYWSATTYAYATVGRSSAWSADFRNGQVLRSYKFGPQNVRAVRSGHSLISNFVDNKDGTVIDTATGLMWQKCPYGQTWDEAQDACTGSATNLNWQQALKAAENLKLAGYDDWRLPNINELQTLVDETVYSPALDTNFFPNKSSGYWSSTTRDCGTQGAWRVDFAYGGLHYPFKPYSTFLSVRAVRGGYSDIGSFDPLRLVFSDISDQTINEPFEVEISIRRGNFIATDINGPLNISASVGRVQTSEPVVLKNGTWTGSATMLNCSESVHLSASGQGTAGTSPSFVVAGCEIQHLGSLKGQVYLRGQILLPDVAIDVHRVVGDGYESTPVKSAYTNEYGMFLMLGLNPGQYLIKASNSGLNGSAYAIVQPNQINSSVSIHLREAKKKPLLVVHGIMGSTTEEQPQRLRDKSIFPKMPKKKPAEIQDLHFLDPTILMGTERPVKLTEFMNDYEDDYAVYKVVWDWRVDLNEAWEKYLKPIIDQAKRETDNESVDIVAHSMGGLLVRTYMQDDAYDHDIDKFVMLGTPNKGSSNTYMIEEGANPSIVDTITGSYFFNPQFYYRTLMNELENQGVYNTTFEPLLELSPTRLQIKKFINDEIPTINQLAPTYPFLVDKKDDRHKAECSDNKFLDDLNNTLPFMKSRFDSTKARLFLSKEKQNTIYTINVRNITDNSEDCCPDKIYPSGYVVPRPWYPGDLINYIDQWKKGDGTVLADEAAEPFREMGDDIVVTGNFGDHSGMFGNENIKQQVYEFLTGKELTSKVMERSTMLLSEKELSEDQSMLKMSIMGDVQPLISDESGRAAGVDPSTLSMVEELGQIQFSTYSGGSYLIMEDIEAALYTVHLHGWENASFRIELEYIAGDVHVSEVVTGFHVDGITEFQIDLSQAGENDIIIPPLEAPASVNSYEQGGNTIISWNMATDPRVIGYRVYAKNPAWPDFRFIGTTAGDMFNPGHAWNDSGQEVDWRYMVVSESSNDILSFYQGVAFNRTPTFLIMDSDGQSIGGDFQNAIPGEAFLFQVIGGSGDFEILAYVDDELLPPDTITQLGNGEYSLITAEEEVVEIYIKDTLTNQKSFFMISLFHEKLESVNPGQGIHGQDLQVEIKGSGFNEDTRIALIPDTRKEPSIGSVTTPGFARDVMVIDNIAYIADGTAGLLVIDVKHPSLPVIIGSVATPGSAHDVMVVGNIAYIADWSGGLQVIDVSNPHLPAIIGSVATPGMSTGVSVVGDTAFIQARVSPFGDDGGYLHIVDISNPSSPTIIGTLDTPGESLEYPGEVCGMTVVANIAYVGDYTSLLIIDVSDLSLPEIIGSVDTPGSARDVMVVDNTAYVADGAGGLQVIDVSNPHLPEIIGSIATPGSADQAAQGVMVIGNTAYIADGSGGLQVIDVSNPHSPEIIGSVATPGSARQVMVVDNTAYVADGAGGLQVIDVRSAFYNAIIGSLETPGTAHNVVVTDNTAYIPDGDWFMQQGDFQIIDISNPTSPEIIGSLEIPEYAHCAKDVSIVGEKAYLIYGYKHTVNDVPHVEGGLLVIDVSIPSSPVIIGSVQTPGDARGVTVVGDTAYIIDDGEWNNSALQIIDVSEPFSPVIIGSVEIPGGGYDRRGVTVVGDTAYVTSWSAGLQIIDVSVPSSPVIIGSADTPGSAQGVTMVGNTAYVADGSGGLQIIDVSIPSVPAIIGSAATPGSARDVMVIDNIAYVADGSKGLLMIDVSIPSSPVIIGSVPTRLHARGVTVIGDTAYIADDEYGLTIVSVPREIESVNVVNASTINVTLPSPYMPGNYTIRVFNDQGEWSELPGVVHFSDLETNQYTVTFLDHDESALKVETVLHGCDATAPEAPTREGHAFTGWDKVFDTITEDLTVTAMYDKLTYHVIYTSAGNGTINGPTPQTVTHGDSSEPVTAQPDTGYHFVQWSDGSTANPRTDTNVTADITVTAVFDYVKGDVNLDGKVNMKDAILLIQYAAGLADLTDAQKKRGNICGHENDNNVGMADAILIFGIIARSH
jgi:pimeloyl-ACP methyl ester carboxylesterase